jgi:hypothetical protein
MKPYPGTQGRCSGMVNEHSFILHNSPQDGKPFIRQSKNIGLNAGIFTENNLFRSSSARFFPVKERR